MLFADLRGWTDFSATTEPEEVIGVIRSYHDTIQAQAAELADWNRTLAAAPSSRARRPARGRAPLLDAEQGADPGQERLLVERLREEVVGAGLDRPHANLRVVRGQHHDRQERRSLVLAQPPAHLEPVHAGHLDVEQDEVGLARLHPLQRLRAGGGGYDVEAVRRQDRLEQARVLRHVVDGEDRGLRVRNHRFQCQSSTFQKGCGVPKSGSPRDLQASPLGGVAVASALEASERCSAKRHWKVRERDR